MSGPFGTSSWMYGIESTFYDHKINQSLRFNAASSPRLIDSSVSSDGNRKKFTFSFWVKLNSDNRTYDVPIGAGGSGSYPSAIIGFHNQRLTYKDYRHPSYVSDVITTAKFRDLSAWYHVVCGVDTTQATAADRVKLYVNGNQITAFDTASYPSQNYDTLFQDSTSGNEPLIGFAPGFDYLNGYIAEVYNIDNAQLTPSSFGETKEGIWIPKDYSGSFGTTGFKLTFSDSSAIGADSSGNSHSFDTVTNLAAHDIVPDSPTNNFATFNPLDISGTTLTYSEGNLKAERTSSSFAQAYSSFSFDSGKWYAEFLLDTGNSGVGVIAGTTNPGTNRYMGQDSYTYGYYSNGQKVNSGSYTSYGDSYTTAADGSGDVIGVYIDADNGNIYFSKNGTVQNSGTAAFTGVTGPFRFAIASESNCFHIANFGQDDTFAGLKTSGSAAASDSNDIGKFYDSIGLSDYLSPCTSNLPDPTIGPEQDTQADDHFNTLLYNGNGNTGQSITGVGFKPEFLWIKNRNITGGYPHLLRDVVRGVTKSVRSDNSMAEETRNEVTSFDADGFTLAGSNSLENDQAGNYVSWNWKAGGATPTKTYKVVVVSDSGNKYRFRNSADSATFAQSAVTLNLQEGGTYTFDVSDSTVSSHPFVIGTAANSSEYSTGVTYKLDGITKTYSEYTSGFSSATLRQLIITVAAGAPTLYYWCSVHSGMGGQINTNSTFGSTNFDGATQAVVSTNTNAGFSIVTYTGTGNGSDTAGHGLTQKPDLVIVKNRDADSSPNYWHVNHKGLAAADNNAFLNLNSAATDVNTNYAEGGIGLGNANVIDFVAGYSGANNVANCNKSGSDYIAYCFHSVEGYSKIGKFTGNSSADGPFVYTGFRPAWVMIKQSSTTGNWNIIDNTRQTFNDADGGPVLRADVTNVEEETNTMQGQIDILSNGFKLRANNSSYNTSGATVIYLAFAEAPFKFANAR